MFNSWNPYGCTTPNYGPTTGHSTPTWTPTWNSGFSPTWNGGPTGQPFNGGHGNPWNPFFQAYFNSFFEAFTAWQWQFITAFIASQTGSVPNFGGFTNPNEGKTNGWTGPSTEFAGMGFPNRNV